MLPAPAAGSWRFRLGIICFIAAFGIHLITLDAPIEAMNFALNEILLLATVALLGKPGFNQFKQIASGVIG